MAEAAESKMRSQDRVLVLEVIDGKKTLSSAGMVDSGLFSGKNKLHAIQDPSSTMWYFKYDMGIVPPILKGQFTSFKALKKFADVYYERRNMRIKEVLD